MNHSKISVKFVFNSFSGNREEFKQSQEIKEALDSLSIKYKLIDVNQEMVFSKAKKITNLRNSLLEKKIIAKIDNKPMIPQLQINDELYINFVQFQLLREANLFEMIINGKVCSHLRFYNDQIVFANNSKQMNKECLYCYSNKKKTKAVIFSIDKFNSLDDEINDALTYCEKNGITLQVNHNSMSSMDLDLRFVMVDECKYSIEEFNIIRDQLSLTEKANLNKCSPLFNTNYFNASIKQKERLNKYEDSAEKLQMKKKRQPNRNNFIFKLNLKAKYSRVHYEAEDKSRNNQNICSNSANEDEKTASFTTPIKNNLDEDNLKEKSDCDDIETNDVMNYSFQM